MSSLANNYKRRKIAFKKGKGSFLYSINGNRYLDFVQGIAVNSLGHSNSYLTKNTNEGTIDAATYNTYATKIING